jgi:2-C-methyl-D-erythritol 2,4-cyclodiphosphate synthase
MRIGMGYDIHRFEAGRRLVLGGVEFPGETGLAGHSDADVLVHAVIDALLGAAGLGDIGGRFPPEDSAYQDADSLQLLRETTRLIAARGFAVESIDSTLIAERPRIATHASHMRNNIASALGTDAGRVNVKATTNEGLAAIGRGEGIAAIAVALIREPD